MWNFGKPKHRIHGLSVVQTEQIRRKSKSEASCRGDRANETRQAQQRAAEEEESSSMDTTCLVYTCCIKGLRHRMHLYMLAVTGGVFIVFLCTNTTNRKT